MCLALVPAINAAAYRIVISVNLPNLLVLLASLKIRKAASSRVGSRVRYNLITFLP
jgi:hypothetical protein